MTASAGCPPPAAWSPAGTSDEPARRPCACRQQERRAARRCPLLICKELSMSEPATSRPAGYPQPDRDAVLPVLQEQLDDLLAARHPQQDHPANPPPPLNKLKHPL